MQLMNMLQGLTSLAAGGSGQAALSFAFPAQTQLPAGQTSFLPSGVSGYGPAALTGAPPLPAPYAKAPGPAPPGGVMPGEGGLGV